MFFNKEDLIDLLMSDELEINGKTAKIVLDEQYDTTRWSAHHELVFSYDNTFYVTSYSRGLTEHQDETPFQYDDNEIECFEVAPVEVVKIEYQHVTKATS
jgi:hypothetical protein